MWLNSVVPALSDALGGRSPSVCPDRAAEGSGPWFFSLGPSQRRLGQLGAWGLLEPLRGHWPDSCPAPACGWGFTHSMVVRGGGGRGRQRRHLRMGETRNTTSVTVHVTIILFCWKFLSLSHCAWCIMKLHHRSVCIEHTACVGFRRLRRPLGSWKVSSEVWKGAPSTDRGFILDLSK